MSTAKNLVSEIENTYLKPLFNRILIFEKNELGIENLNFEFFMLLGSKCVKFVDFTVLN